MTDEPEGRIGSAFDDFLKVEGTFEEVQAGALKKVVAHQLGEALKAQKLTNGISGDRNSGDSIPI